MTKAQEQRQERINHAFRLHFTDGIGIKEACKQAKIGTVTFYRAVEENNKKTQTTKNTLEDLIADFEAAVRAHECLGMREPEEHDFIELEYNITKQILLNKLTNTAKMIEIYTKYLLR